MKFSEEKEESVLYEILMTMADVLIQSDTYQNDDALLSSPVTLKKGIQHFSELPLLCRTVPKLFKVELFF